MRKIRAFIVMVALIAPLLLVVSESQSQSSTIGVWNKDGNFNLSVWDSSNQQDKCYLAAPWGLGSWGVEGSTFSDPANFGLDWSHFMLSASGQGYLYGKEESGKWGSVRFIQGDAWGGSNCGAIPWYKPAPLPVANRQLTLKISLYRDTNALLTTDQSWLMFAVNVWLKSPELPKRLVMDLAFYHECNLSPGCSLSNFEDASAYHYQVFIGETPYQAWESWTINLSEHVDAALQTFNLLSAADTLSIYQLEFLTELRNAEAAASVDDFFLEYRYFTDPPKRNYYTTPMPRLTWDVITWATSYQVEIDRTATFSNPDRFIQEVAASVLLIEPTLDNGSYYWRVRARRADGSWGAWSAADTFIVDAP